MATISTSSKAVRICFTGMGRDAGEQAVFDLLPVQAVPNAIQLADGGSVLDAATYELSLRLDVAASSVRAMVSINGGEPEEFVHTKTSLIEGEVECAAFRMSRVNQRRPDEHAHAAQYFKMTYGFARVGVELYLEGEADPVLLTTRDIPCRTQSSTDSAYAEKMLGELLDSDDVPSRWMFGGAQGGAGPYAILDGRFVEHAARSLTSMLELIGRALGEYERRAGFFRSGARSRIVQRSRTVPLGSVRAAGRDELIWLSRNTGVLVECSEREGMFYNGGWYLPRKVETSVRVKTFDSYENRCVLGFLAKIAHVVPLLRSTLERASGEICTIEDRLLDITRDASTLPALAIVRAYASRERRLLGRLDAYAAQARTLLHAYRSFMPDVQEVFGYNVRRTKVFTEVQPYLHLYELMREWLAFGDFSLVREGLALQAAKMDKLYEYFVLHRMLRWLYARGFEPAGCEEAAIRCGAYEPEGFYKPETGVSTIYELARPSDDGTVNVRLYYQPIIHSDMREEEGITLHRLSYREGARFQNYWTPDYFLEVTDPTGARRYHIVDAKYRAASDLFPGYPRAGELAECVLKYRTDVMGAAGERVSSIWLVAGKGRSSDVYYAESSPWAAASLTGPRSGVTLLTTDDDLLDVVFTEVFQDIGCVLDAEREESGLDGADVVGAMGALPLGAVEAVPLSAASTDADRVDEEVRLMVEPAQAETADAGPSTDGALLDDVSVGGGLADGATVDAAANGAAAGGDMAGGDTADGDSDAGEEPAGTCEAEVPGPLNGERPTAGPDQDGEQPTAGPDQDGERRARKRHKPKRAPERPKPAPSAPKPIKKANLPKPKTVKKRGRLALFDLDDETRGAVEYVTGHIEDVDLLFNGGWAQAHLGLERPLLRKRAPEGRESGFYELVPLGGEECWRNTRWTPVQKNKVKSFARSLEQKGEAAGRGESAPDVDAN